jgi:hypothetical protein
MLLFEEDFLMSKPIAKLIVENPQKLLWDELIKMFYSLPNPLALAKLVVNCHN